MTSVAGRDVFPLSFAQTRLWILDRFQPGNPTYNIPAATPLPGRIDVDALQRSLNDLVRRHETLRTTFEIVDGQPAQVVAPSLHVELEVIDLRRMSRWTRDAQVARFMFEESRRPFDLATGPLLRASLLQLGETDNLLVLVMHHIVSDGWSMGVLYRELATIYTAYARGEEAALPDLPIQYADFARWQADWMRGDVLEEQLGYWRKQLAGLRPVLDLPTDRPRPPVQSNRGDIRGFMLDRALCEELKTLSQAHGATLFMTLLAAFKALLHRLSGEVDVAVGSPIANRTRPELEGLIGFFVNTLVLRTDLSGDPTFLELLAREREVALGAYAHQDMPFEKLVEELHPERDLAHNPLFQILFAVQNFGTVDRNAPDPGPQGPMTGNGTAKFDLTMSLMDTGAGAQGAVEYNTDLFDAATIAVMIERYVTLLRGVAEYPEWRLSQLPIASEAERDRAPSGWGGETIEDELIETVGAVLAARAALTGDAVAVKEGQVELTFRELDARAQRVARALRARGAASGSVVAIAMTRGLDAIVAVAGVLAAGCVYVPVDPADPPARTARVLSTTRAAFVIVDERTREQHASGAHRALPFGELERADAPEAGAEPLPAAAPESVACLVYATDAAGAPRAIGVTHRALCRAAYDASIRLRVGERVAHLSHAASDAARYEIFGALADGATIVCVPDASAASPRALAAMLRDLGVTALFASLATVERLSREFPWSLRKVTLLLADERVADWTRVREALKHEIVERIACVYGDPEAGGYFLVQPLAWVAPSAPVIPMGNPVPNETVYVLDANFEPVPRGVPGEVYVASDLLAGNAGAPASALIVSPFGDELLLRTGDHARHLPDGPLEHRGRRDRRMLLGGLHVYPAEIEAMLRAHPHVRDAAVAPRRRHGLRDRGVLALIETDGTPVGDDELRELARRELPDALVPSAFRTVEALARTPGGEVDRRALEDAAAAFDAPKPAQEPYVAPRDAIERRLAAIWAETLGVDRVGIKDNFFRLGGHSLLATQAVARIADAFRIDLPLQRLFEAPVIEALAKVVESLAGDEAKAEILPIVRVARDRPLPLSFAQQRLWFLDQFEPDSAFYNMPVSMRWSAVDPPLLELAFNDLVARHETLRTTFEEVDGSPVQVIAPPSHLTIPVHDLRRRPEAERESELQRLTALEAQTPFQLRTGPVVRAAVVRLADDDAAVLLTVHHIAADGWSIDILFRELLALYDARRTHRPAPLPELRVQYADFAAWQRAWLEGDVLERQVTYWKRQLAGAPPVLELPTDRPRPAVQKFSGGVSTFAMPGSLLEAAKALASQEQTTLFTVLLAAFYVLLHRYTGSEDLLVGSPIAGRVRPELEPLIGFFANTLVLRTRVAGTLPFRGLVEHVRETTLGAYANQDVPFEKLVEELQPARSLAYNPLFQVMFAMQNMSRPAADSLEEAETTPVVGAGIAKFDLTMFMIETTTGLRAGIEYNSDLFDADTIGRLAAHYEALLEAATTDPERPIWSLPMLSAAESIALAEWNDTARPDGAVCVHRMFEAQAARTPAAAALVDAGRTMSYEELNRRANRCAHRLLALGVKPDACVGIALDRSAGAVVAILAALKAGAAYVPLDPAYPAERIALMLRGSRAAAVLTTRALRDRLPETAAEIVEIDADAAGRDDDPVSTVAPANLAYVIYTSGSTGIPKGVAMPHAPLANLLRWQIARSALAGEARTLQLASMSFDVSFQEIFATLCAGGTLVLVTDEQKRDPRALWQLMRAQRVERLFLPYVALQQLAEEAARTADLPESLAQVITAGEQLQVTPQIAALFERLGASLRNQYGPTESHVVTELELAGPPREWPARPTIGRPIPNATIHVLDRFGQPCALGTPGELHIGGLALARGYIHRADLTADRFGPDAHGAGSGRLYRTGDRARFLAGGSIEFLGRNDDQVKVRGFRVEPGEVEAALRTHRGIREAAVVARPGAGGDTRLVAYVLPATEAAPPARDLRAHLAELLPEYMVPSAFVVLAALPLTPSGKIDRRALPDPEPPNAPPPAAIKPRTPVEQALARIWCEVLELPGVAVHDNFFDLGGHSLLATRVIARVRDEFGVELPVRRSFEAPTIELLALAVVEAALETQGDDETARLLAEIEQMPDAEASSLVHGAPGD